VGRRSEQCASGSAPRSNAAEGAARNRAAARPVARRFHCPSESVPAPSGRTVNRQDASLCPSLKKRTTQCPGRMFTNSEKDTRSIPWEFVRPGLHRTTARASRKITHALYSTRPRLCSSATAIEPLLAGAKQRRHGSSGRRGTRWPRTSSRDRHENPKPGRRRDDRKHICATVHGYQLAPPPHRVDAKRTRRSRRRRPLQRYRVARSAVAAQLAPAHLPPWSGDCGHRPRGDQSAAAARAGLEQPAGSR
jgi:hypothetical protein